MECSKMRYMISVVTIKMVKCCMQPRNVAHEKIHVNGLCLTRQHQRLEALK